jgi:cell division initiation protein
MDDNQRFSMLLLMAIENLMKQNEELREALGRAELKLNEYRDIEQSMRDTLVETLQLAQEYKENAKKEANLIIQEARLRAMQAEETKYED